MVQFPRPNESQTSSRNMLRLAMCRAIGGVASTANLRYAALQNAPALLSTSLRLAATPKALAAPGLVKSFVLVDGDQPNLITAVVEKNASRNLIEYKYSFDPLVPKEDFKSICIGESTFTVRVPEGGKLRMMVAELNRASKPDNVLFTDIKTRIAQ